MKHGWYLSSLLVLLLVSSSWGDSVKIVNENIHMGYWSGALGETGYNYGASTTLKVGNVLSNCYHIDLSLYHMDDSMYGDIDSVRCSVYISTAPASAKWYFIYRLDSTKVHREGIQTGAAAGDCHCCWLRYEEAAGAEPDCTDRAWASAGGDHYGVKLDSFQVSSTGWCTWKAGDSLVAYWEKVMDGDITVDTSLLGGTSAKAAVGNLIIENDAAGDDAIIHSDDNASNKPAFWFWGVTAGAQPDGAQEWGYVHKYQTSLWQHKYDSSKIIHRHKDD